MYKDSLERLHNYSGSEAQDDASKRPDELSTRALMVILSACAIFLGAAVAVHSLLTTSAEPNSKDGTVMDSELASAK
jgi:hypothetical protein